MATTDGMVREALGDLDARLDHWRETLVALCRIPGVSAAGFPPEEVGRSAPAVAQALRGAGVENVEVLDIAGVHPYVYGDWLHRPGAPTVLLYGHHDVMPPGRADGGGRAAPVVTDTVRERAGVHGCRRRRLRQRPLR